MAELVFYTINLKWLVNSITTDTENSIPLTFELFVISFVAFVKAFVSFLVKYSYPSTK
jgi:hypothetical protein